MKRYIGLDIGSCTTKAVVIDDRGNILSSHVCRSGVDFNQAAREALEAVLGANGWKDMPIVSTGYGRRSLDFVTETRTEIACHARGGYRFFPQAMTLIDIGGQDNKVIKLDAGGRRLDFKMNRKCAAGTGTFIEEIANKMAVPLDELDEMARKAEKRVKIGSYCTVFASTEILGLIRTGVSPEELVRGVFESVVDRVMEMVPVTDFLLLCGGVVAHNPVVADIFRERTIAEVAVPPHPQLTGAYGAALYASQEGS